MEEKIKELTNKEDFKEVYKVFSGPPYNEKYTDEELEEIFSEYKEKGYIYGAFNKGRCIGMIALERGAKESQPVKFSNEKVMYLADVAVLNEYRRKGLGNQLMIYGVIQSKRLGFDKLYMRTLEEGSMSRGIALRIGFKQIPGILQGVERERTNGTTEIMQNIFLEIDLNNLNREALAQGIQMSTPETKTERGICQNDRDGRDSR